MSASNENVKHVRTSTRSPDINMGDADVGAVIGKLNAITTNFAKTGIVQVTDNQIVQPDIVQRAAAGDARVSGNFVADNLKIADMHV